jgi:hypothetical protein
MQPKIKYTLIGNTSNIIIDNYKNEEDFVDYVRDFIFPNIINSKKEGCYIWTSQGYDIVYETHKNGIIILALTEKGFKKDISLLYLQYIYKSLLEAYTLSHIQYADKFSFSFFKEKIIEIAEDFENNYLAKLEDPMIEQIIKKTVIVESLEKIVSRISQMEEMRSQYQEINESEIHLIQKEKIKYLKKRDKKHYLLIFLLVTLFSLLCYFLLVVFCEGFTLKRCF